MMRRILVALCPGTVIWKQIQRTQKIGKMYLIFSRRQITTCFSEVALSKRNKLIASRGDTQEHRSTQTYRSWIDPRSQIRSMGMTKCLSVVVQMLSMRDSRRFLRWSCLRVISTRFVIFVFLIGSYKQNQIQSRQGFQFSYFKVSPKPEDQ